MMFADVFSTVAVIVVRAYYFRTVCISISQLLHFTCDFKVL